MKYHFFIYTIPQIKVYTEYFECKNLFFLDSSTKYQVEAMMVKYQIDRDFYGNYKGNIIYIENFLGILRMYGYIFDNSNFVI
jgi:hypothetical protein